MNNAGTPAPGQPATGHRHSGQPGSGHCHSAGSGQLQGASRHCNSESSGQLSGSGSGQLQASTEPGDEINMQNLARSLRTLELPSELRALALYARAPTRRYVMRLKVARHIVQPLRARPVNTL